MQNRRSSIGDQGLPVDWVRPCETEAPEDFPPRVPVTSTSLRSVGYNPEAHELDLEFKDGRLYRYSGVPAEVHDELLHAP
ncbi:MAG TPA: KTSC domain-containing protein, partial [Polyangium sp.]|nr:KTSC domain-containing protein [Polyangium sp.]